MSAPEKEEYLLDPCGASSLSFRKSKLAAIPENMRIIRDDAFDPACFDSYIDTPYFKAIHRLAVLEKPELPHGFRLVAADAEEFSRHIRECFGGGPDAADTEFQHLFAPENASLRITLADEKTGKIAASGLAEIGAEIGEGSLEWIQVSPEYRRAGLGTFIVRELLRRLAFSQNARFATVSGQLNSEWHPLALYEKCGFAESVIWHVLMKK